MQNNIIHEVTDLINKHLPIHFNTEDFKHYLWLSIKPKNGISSRDYKLFNLSDFIHIAAENSNETEKNSKNPQKRLTANETKTLTQAILSDRTGILSLYRKYNCPVSEEEDTRTLLTELIYMCLAKDTCRFAPSKPLLKSTDTIVGRMEDATKLKSLLDQHHKIVVCGDPGSGKSHFVKYCLSTWNIKNYHYICYEGQEQIKETLYRIPYYPANGDINDIYFGSDHELRKPCFSSALLIIDDMHLSPGLPAALQWLSKLKVNILVITRRPVKTKSFYSYELPALSDESLLEIYSNETGKPLTDSLLQQKLFKTTGRNALMVSLISRLCRKIGENTPSDSLASLKNILEQFSCPQNHLKGPYAAVRYKHAYTDYGKTLDALGHIKKAYVKSKDFMAPALSVHMKYLCGFGWERLPLSFLALVISDYGEKELKTLHEMGLVTLTEETVQLSPLICQAAFAEEVPDLKKGELDEISLNIMNFLKNYDQTLSVPYLSDALLKYAQAFYKRIPVKNNKAQKKTSKKFENWQEFLFLIYCYYHQAGDFQTADKVVSLINYPELLINAHSYLDKDIFSLGSHMQQEACLKEMVEEIDRVCRRFKEDPESALQAKITSYLTTVLDTAIGFYCASFSTSSDKDDASQNYLIDLKNVIRSQLHCIQRPQHNSKITVSTEVFHYYILCLQLMTTDSPNYKDYIVRLNFIKQWKNANYRVRGAAFVVYMENFFVSWILIHIAENDICLYKVASLFASLIPPEITYLRNQIRTCKLIPVHTLRICLYTYFQTIKTQHHLFCIDRTANIEIPPVVNISDFEELLDRSVLKNEEKVPIIEAAEVYLSRLFWCIQNAQNYEEPV